MQWVWGLSCKQTFLLKTACKPPSKWGKYALSCLRGALPKSVFMAEKQWVGFSERAEALPKGEDFVGPFLFPGMVEEFVTDGVEGLWIATGGQEPVGVQAAIDPAGHSQHQGVGVGGGLNPAHGGSDPSLGQEASAAVEPASEHSCVGSGGRAGGGDASGGRDGEERLAKVLKKPAGVGVGRGAAGRGRV